MKHLHNALTIELRLAEAKRQDSNLQPLCPECSSIGIRRKFVDYIEYFESSLGVVLFIISGLFRISNQ